MLVSFVGLGELFGVGTDRARDFRRCFPWYRGEVREEAFFGHLVQGTGLSVVVYKMVVFKMCIRDFC